MRRMLAIVTFALIANCFPALPGIGATAPAPKPAPPVKPEPKLVVQELGQRLWRLAGVEEGGVLVLDGADGLLIVDTQDSTTATQLDANLAKLSRHPVRWVIDTHYHQDHTGGNARYRERGAVVIAQANVAAQAMKDTTVADMGWHRKPILAGGLPEVTFADSLRLRVNGEDIVLWHPIDAHTDGDLMLWLPARDLIHTGDIVEVNAPPFIDWWAGGTLDGMIAAVERVIAMSGDQTRIVPGHGDVVDRAWVIEYRRMLIAARERAKDAIARGVKLKDYADSRPLAEWESRLGGEKGAHRFAAQTYYGVNGMKVE